MSDSSLVALIVRLRALPTETEWLERLLPKLPDRLTGAQKIHKIHNRLQKLRRAGRIVNRGTRARSAWHLGASADV